MRRRILGRTGIEISELGFGGLFASSLGLGFEQSRRSVHRAVDSGINYFDTAPAYADSEEILGKILADIRGPLILSTKLGGRPQPFDPQSKEQLRYSVEQSLRMLRREVIDILFVHEPDRPLQYNWWTKPEAVVGPVIEVMDEFKQRGLVRFTGVGGTTVTEMAHIMRAGHFDVVLTAFNYSLLFREAANEVLPTARERDMGVVLGSVLHQGALGRRFDEVIRSCPMWLSRLRQQQFLALYELLDELGTSLVELCLRFAISNSNVSTVLIGPKTPEHVDESVAAISKGPLPADLLAKLDLIAAMVPFRPFEEPMILPLNNPRSYYGPGMANLGVGIPVGKLRDVRTERSL